MKVQIHVQDDGLILHTNHQDYRVEILFGQQGYFRSEWVSRSKAYRLARDIKKSIKSKALTIAEDKK